MIEQHIDFNPKVVFEIGVGPCNTSRSRPFWETAECHLFEPLRKFVIGLRKDVAKFPKVHLHEVAIWKESGQTKFFTEGQGSFIENVDSPSKQYNRGKTPKKTPKVIEGDNGEFMIQTPSQIHKKHTQVQTETLDVYDQGNIDVLLLDMEGAEYHALEKLVSRPRFISVECKAGEWYVNPHLQEIEYWMNREGYEEVGTDGDADFYFKRKT